MKETLIDIETYCEADIKKCGLYRYVSDPSFEILLIAWATDEGEGFGETKLADLASGDPFPQELLDDFKDSNVTLIAHNAAFERVSFSRYLQQHYPGQYLKPGTFLSPDNWICTMVMAASLTLPMALKDVGEVLRTTQQKDEEGKRLIKLFSAPCKPTKSNGGRTRNLPHHLPEDWAKFKYYCIQDVNTEVDIYKRLKRFPMPAREWHHYRVNERINDRGVRIDTELVQQAITCDLLLSDAMTTKAYIARRFGVRMGNAEERAFITGDGVGKPLGLLAETGGAKVGVKAAKQDAVTFDEIFKLYYALKAPYRKKAQFLCNEALVLQLMTIKDNNGNYIWKPGLEIGKPDTLLNRPLRTSAFMPEIKGGNKVMAFGDYSYYWVADRQNRTFRRLNELYARTDQVGFLTTQRVDGKLILPESVQLLQMAAGG